jgi:ubiquinone/menaquinone biosynthesis C-methylase UbiE
MGKFHSTDFSKIAREYCKGSGIEIGGLHSRLNVEADVKVLDYLDTESLKKKYKDDVNVNLDDLWNVDIVSQAWIIPKVKDNSLDFVMSSHVLEHLPNPSVAIEEWIRVVKPGGTVFFIVPDMRFTFDKNRSLTNVQTLMEKHNTRTEKVDYDTYKEFATCTNGLLGSPAIEITEEYLQLLYKQQENIHVHTFTENSVNEFVNALSHKLGFEVRFVQGFGMHINVVLIKNS